MWFHLVCAVLCSFLVSLIWSRRKFYQLSWKMPGPWGFPLVGNALMFLNTSDVIQSITAMSNCFKTPLRFWLGPRFLIYCKDPSTIETILNSPHTMDKGRVYEYVKLVLGGEGLFTSGGAQWKTHRKLLNPTIQHFNILNSFYPIFNRSLKVLIDKLESKVGKDQFNIYNFLEACSLDMICETTFGTKMNTQDNKNLGFLDSANMMMYVAGILIFQPWYQIKAVFKLSKFSKLLHQSTTDARNFATKIIDSKTEEFKNKGQSNSDVVDDNGNMLQEEFIEKKQLNIFIDECVKLSLKDKRFTNIDIINESITMLTGGFETTATTVSYMALMLAMHPEYQQQVFEEIREIFPEQNSDITADDLGKLEFTNRFIKESMRVVPTVPYLTRYTKKDFKLGEYDVPAGTELILSIFDMHRNKEVWGPDADKFNPDHFLPENLENKHAYAFIPFSAGPRNCIGLKYGNIVIRMFLCWMVRHYIFKTDLTLEKLNFRMNITLKLENQHMLTVEKRSLY